MSLSRKSRQGIKEDRSVVEAAREASVVPGFRRLKEIAAKGVVVFCREALGFDPTDY